MGQPRPRVPGMTCPHCNSQAIARSSQTITPICRQLYYRCNSDECGHAFIAQLAVLHSVRASDTPNPDVHLPLRVAAFLKPLAQPIPANDQPGDPSEMLERIADR